MQFNDDLLSKLAQQNQQKGNFQEAIDLLKKTSFSQQRNNWLADLYYESGKKNSAENRWSDADVDFTRAHNLQPDKVKKDLSHQRLLWLKRRAIESAYGAEWKSMHRACSKCPGTASLLNCATCSRFGEPINSAQQISRDMLNPPIDELWVPAAYRSGYDPARSNPFSRLVRLAKNGNAEKACRILGYMLAEYIDNGETNFRQRVDLILPVPTSKDRLAQRGYSIPRLIAESIATRFCLPPIDGVLTLNHNTQETRGLSQYYKRQILSDAFRVSKPEYVKDLSILLIDDIMTTGTTLQYAAIAIKNYKPKNILALVLAHTEHTWSWEES